MIPNPGDSFQTVWYLECNGYLPGENADTCVRWSNDEAEMVLLVPNSWEYDTIKNETGDTIGIQLRPQGEEGWIRFRYYPEGFGVCGTGLKADSGVTSKGYLYQAGYYDGNPTWSYLAFQGLYRDFVVLNESAGWFAAYEPEIMKILNTAMLSVDK